MVLFMIGLLAAVLAACGSISMDDGTLTLDFSISEQTINGLISRTTDNAANATGDLLFDTVTGVDLIEPDIIRVFGSGTADGQPISGSYDVRVGAEEGALRLAVTDVDVPGVGLDDPRVVQANADLQDAFTEQVTNEGGRGVVQSATISGGELRLVIAAPIGQ
jgi:hypothetical protein